MQSGSGQIIGRGTWLDQLAARVVAREQKLGRSTGLIRVESGLSASGIPHVGNIGDAIRAYGVKLALQDSGYRSELIAFSDDLDALRKVPAGMPDWLGEYIGRPVSNVPDPFDCHQSYGAHSTSMMKEALDDLSIEYKAVSGSEAYSSGLLNEQMQKILANAEKIGKKIAELLGQTKFETVLPYFPICHNCGRIALAQAHAYVPEESKVMYKCAGAEIGRKWVNGCGYEGEADITKGKGKLSWKGEFAARWAALDIRFEPFGKELADSAKVNDWISDEILGFPPPYHVQYEHFLFAGKKISKSVGNVITPQTWLRYGTPQSLMLLMFKRIKGARNLSIEEIPKYVEEYDLLEDIYFGREKIENEMKLAKLRGLYEYVNHLKPPTKPDQHVPYGLLVQLASVAPKHNIIEFVSQRLIRYGSSKRISEGLTRRIEIARNWADDFKTTERVQIGLGEAERRAIAEMAKYVVSQNDPQKIQSEIFEVARRHGIDASRFFEILYKILIGSNRGPRLGPYIFDIGAKTVADLLSQYT